MRCILETEYHVAKPRGSCQLLPPLIHAQCFGRIVVLSLSNYPAYQEPSKLQLNNKLANSDSLWISIRGSQSRVNFCRIAKFWVSFCCLLFCAFLVGSQVTRDIPRSIAGCSMSVPNLQEPPIEMGTLSAEKGKSEHRLLHEVNRVQHLNSNNHNQEGGRDIISTSIIDSREISLKSLLYLPPNIDIDPRSSNIRVMADQGNLPLQVLQGNFHSIQSKAYPKLHGFSWNRINDWVETQMTNSYPLTYRFSAQDRREALADNNTSSPSTFPLQTISSATNIQRAVRAAELQTKIPWAFIDIDGIELTEDYLQALTALQKNEDGDKVMRLYWRSGMTLDLILDPDQFRVMVFASQESSDEEYEGGGKCKGPETDRTCVEERDREDSPEYRRYRPPRVTVKESWERSHIRSVSEFDLVSGPIMTATRERTNQEIKAEQIETSARAILSRISDARRGGGTEQQLGRVLE